MAISAVVLAAGKGTRMKSGIAKPLHKIMGRELVNWTADALAPLELSRLVVVVGHASEAVEQCIKNAASGTGPELVFAKQESQNGTGHAAVVALEELDAIDLGADPSDLILVLPGDAPLIRTETLQALIDTAKKSEAAGVVLTTVLEDPTGYGRILRNSENHVAHIREHVDASEQELQVREVNAGMYCFRRSLLGPALAQLGTDNAQAELYLTDVVRVFTELGHNVVPLSVDPVEVLGVNDQIQLAEAAKHARERIVLSHMKNGVAIPAPETVYIDVDVEIGSDVVIDAFSVIRRGAKIASGSRIGPHAFIEESAVSDPAGNQAGVAGSVAINHCDDRR